MIRIDMQKLRDTLPKNGIVTLKHNTTPPTSIYIVCNISWPNLSERFPLTWEKDFQQIKDWQRQIIGDALSEFYTKTEGQLWIIYLKRVPISLENCSDEDIRTYSGFTIQQLIGK
jgi:hypothetical protein